jgi:tRNA (guanine26-N2/guanine27-N2)-dimethyltransferase
MDLKERNAWLEAHPAPEGFDAITEGAARVIFENKNEVFYNPSQEVNRDLSVLVLRQFSDQLRQERGEKFDGITILEALSATGLRSIRYWKEVPAIKSIVANDIETAAVKNIRRNVEFNGISDTKVIPNQGDARAVMYQNPKSYDVIDLDPYGSGAEFFDAAVQSINDGGLICVTCTDMQVLCGNYPEVCSYKYGALPLKGKPTHEQAVRIVLASLERSAARYQRHIVPLISLSMDFYVRMFVRVYTRPEEAKRSMMKLSHVYQCAGCGSLHFQPLGRCEGKGASVRYLPAHGPPVNRACDECGRDFKVLGPIWNKSLFDEEFIHKAMAELEKNSALFRTHKKVNGYLSVLSQELPDQPLFYDLPAICKVLHAQQPPMSIFKSAILNADRGYRISISHTAATAIKTDAPPSFLWDVLRGWNKLHPVRPPAPGSVAEAILEKEPSFEADFTEREDAKTQKTKKPRFVLNPPNWGPGTRRQINVKRAAPEAEETERKEGEEEEEDAGEKEEGEGTTAPRHAKKKRQDD